MTANIEKAETTLHSLLEAMQTFVAIVEVDGTVSFANKIPLQAAGLETNDVLGKKILGMRLVQLQPRNTGSYAELCTPRGSR